MKSKKDGPEEPEVARLSAIDEDVLTVLLGRELYGLEVLDELNPGRPIKLRFGSVCIRR